jgi:hypothetical protein
MPVRRKRRTLMMSDEKTTNQDAASEESEDISAAGEKASHAAGKSPSVAVEDKTAGLTSQGDDFLADADAPQVGLVAEFVDFLKYNKKWWMTPILVVLALIALLVIISATGGAPFIYALF